MKMPFGRKKQSPHDIELIKNKLIGKKTAHERAIEKLRVQQQHLKEQASHVAGKDETKLKELAKRHALLSKQEKVLASQVSLISNMINAIEVKSFLQGVEVDMKEVEKKFLDLGIDQKQYEGLFAKLKLNLGETSEAIEEMGSLVVSLSGEGVEMSETEEAFLQEVLAEKGAKEIGVEQSVKFHVIRGSLISIAKTLKLMALIFWYSVRYPFTESVVDYEEAMIYNKKETNA